MIGGPLKKYLIEFFYKAPDYLGTVDEVALTTEGGKRFADVAGRLQEVVIVGMNDVSQMIVSGPEGVYVVGTGRVGVAEAFVTLGVLYFVVMMIAACSYRLPAPGWLPAGWTPPSEEEAAKGMITTHYVEVDEAMKTPQFYLLWIVLCFNVTAGIGVLGVAKTMMSEIFGTTLPDTVDGEFAAAYVLMISVFNMAGRFFWATVSDFIGRKNTDTIFRAGRRSVFVDSVHRLESECLAGRDLACLLLRGDDDHFYDVRWWIRDHPRLSFRLVRNQKTLVESMGDC
jgi:hypothetical protein